MEWRTKKMVEEEEPVGRKAKKVGCLDADVDPSW